MLKVSAGCVIFAIYPVGCVCCRTAELLWSKEGTSAFSLRQSVLTACKRLSLVPECLLLPVLYKETLINILGSLYLQEPHKCMKMREKLTGKFMVSSFFINYWLSVASSCSHEVLGFWRGVELRHGRVHQCSHGEGRVTSS